VKFPTLEDFRDAIIGSINSKSKDKNIPIIHLIRQWKHLERGWLREILAPGNSSSRLSADEKLSVTYLSLFLCGQLLLLSPLQYSSSELCVAEVRSRCRRERRSSLSSRKKESSSKHASSDSRSRSSRSRSRTRKASASTSNYELMDKKSESRSRKSSRSRSRSRRTPSKGRKSRSRSKGRPVKKEVFV
jgi:hypothetical protein